MIKANLPSMGDEETTISFKELEYIPVTYKCFDRIIVNARDQRERLKDREGAVNLTEIRVNIDKVWYYQHSRTMVIQSKLRNTVVVSIILT